MSLFQDEVPAWLRKPAAGHLSPQQVAALDALFGRILPADPARQIVGAREAGASAFVSQLLAMDADTYYEIPAWRKLYGDGLPALEQYAANRYGKSIAELYDAQMNELLTGLESGALAGLPAGIDQKLLFVTLRRHCIQGCFADPRWGGNKDRIVWRAIGYLQPPEDLFHE
jgi:gluconate 2-dehydrogenase gamma chain